MRIAGSTIRRNYLARYEKNFGDKYESERKIESYHKFQRGSENPIDAAQALRVRKSISEVQTYQENLKSANTIYTNAESSMMKISEIIQNVYEKLVEGAHGTRNQGDMDIIAMSIDNYAEEMVQSMNIDIADRKVFGGTNNETVAFKIEQDATGGKFVTYNGVAVNSSSDPYSFPSSERSYLDIGIGMETNKLTDRIDDQSAFPITFNGVECTGCGVSKSTVKIDLDTIMPNVTYNFRAHAGGISSSISFTVTDETPGSNQTEKKVNAINEAFKASFKRAPDIAEDGTITFSMKDLNGDPIEPEIRQYNSNANGGPIGSDGLIDFDSLEKGQYYSMQVDAGGTVRTIEFKVPTDDEVPGAADDDSDPDTEKPVDKNTTLMNIRKALDSVFGDGRVKVYSDGSVTLKGGEKCGLSNNEINNVPTSDGKSINMGSLEDGKIYTFNLNGTKVSFQAGPDAEANQKALQEAFEMPLSFGKTTVPYINDAGVVFYDDDESNISLTDTAKGSQVDITNVNGYSNNIMQLVLDSAKALRDGDQQLVARYADLIYAAQGTLSIAIADLGTHSKFIEFNQDRLSDTMINLYTRQNDLESTDLTEEITNWKVLDSVYNATLQMGANVLQQSIFDYIH